MMRPAGEATQALVSSGRVLGLDVRIVDPDTLDELPDGRIGEIWVRGESVAAGYWGKPEESARSFDVRTAQGHGGFLRTGDLGVLWEEELYVTGRIKDLIIINGRNIYPHDIEAQVSRLDPAFAGLFGSACSIPGKTEKILVMQELRVPDEGTDLERLAREVCRELTRSLDVAVSNVAFLRRGEVRRTTSGKVRRAAMKELFLTGGLVTLHEELDPDVARRFRTEAPQPVPAGPGVPA